MTKYDPTTIPSIDSQPSIPNEFADKIAFLENRIASLSEICDELNPYLPINEELKKKLKAFHILELEDPFKITNALLTLLEDAIDELHIYKPVDPKEIFR